MFNSVEIKNVGLLKEAKLENLSKLNVIYAQNGKGKTTFTDIFQSLDGNSPKIIESRKTIDSNELPLIKLHSQAGTVKFANGAWRKSISNPSAFSLSIFNSDFIEKNVYAGQEINPNNRKNLLTFALGSRSVESKIKLSKAENLANTLKKALEKNKNEIIKTICEPSNISIESLIRTSRSDIIEIEGKIDELSKDIVRAQNASRILNRSVIDVSTFSSITDSIPIEGFEKTLNFTIDSLHKESALKVQEHINSCNSNDRWIRDGMRYVKENNCPFCGQDLSNSNIFESYQTFFNEEIIKFQTQLEELITDIQTGKYRNLINSLKNWERELNNIIKQWQEDEFQNLTLPNIENIYNNWTEMLDTAKSALNEKRVSQNRDLSESPAAKKVNSLLQLIRNESRLILENCNQINESWNSFKEKYSDSDLPALESQMGSLRLSKIRSEDYVDKMLERLRTLEAREAKAKNLVESCRSHYKSEVSQLLSEYSEDINSELRDLNAEFQLSRFSVNFRRGERTEFNLKLRENEVATSGAENMFKTSLSEGDKRTLSFALFITALKRDPDISNKIVIFDDPFTSLDSARKLKTVKKIIDLNNIANQTFVLTHDEFFAKLIFEQGSIGGSLEVKMVQLKPSTRRYSIFCDLDIVRLCQSSYYRSYDTIFDYLEDPTDFLDQERNVAITIRLLLEGYLHRKFPRKLPKGQTLGKVIKAIEDDISYFNYSAETISKMRDINAYSSKYHHDTNPNAENEPIFDDELNRYCRDTLNIIHA